MSTFTESILIPKGELNAVSAKNLQPNQRVQVQIQPTVNRLWESLDQNSDDKKRRKGSTYDDTEKIQQILDEAYTEDEKQLKKSLGKKQKPGLKKWNFLKKRLDQMYQELEKKSAVDMETLQSILDGMWDMKETQRKDWEGLEKRLNQVLEKKKHKKLSKEMQEKLNELFQDDSVKGREEALEKRLNQILAKKKHKKVSKEMQEKLNELFQDDSMKGREERLHEILSGKKHKKKQLSKGMRQKVKEILDDISLLQDNSNNLTSIKKLIDEGKGQRKKKKNINTQKDRDTFLKSKISRNYLADQKHLKKLYASLKNRSKRDVSSQFIPAPVHIPKLEGKYKREMLASVLGKRRLQDESHLRELSKKRKTVINNEKTVTSDTSTEAKIKAEKNVEDENILSHFNEHNKAAVKEVLTIIRKKPEIISWKGPNLEIVIRGNTIPNTRLTDILGYLFNKKKKKYLTSFGDDGLPLGTMRFVEALKNYFPGEDLRDYIKFRNDPVKALLRDINLENMQRQAEIAERNVKLAEEKARSKREEIASANVRRKQRIRSMLEPDPVVLAELRRRAREKDRRRAMGPDDIMKETGLRLIRGEDSTERVDGAKASASGTDIRDSKTVRDWLTPSGKEMSTYFSPGETRSKSAPPGAKSLRGSFPLTSLWKDQSVLPTLVPYISPASSASAHDSSATSSAFKTPLSAGPDPPISRSKQKLEDSLREALKFDDDDDDEEEDLEVTIKKQ